MNTDFHSSLNVAGKHRKHLSFLKWFIPLFFLVWVVVAIVFWDKIGLKFFLQGSACGAAATAYAWFITAKLNRTQGNQSWTVANGRAKYETPSSLLGSSFDVPLSEIRRIKIVDESNSAEIDLRDGTSVGFPADDREGLDFYKFVKEYVDRQQTE